MDIQPYLDDKGYMSLPQRYRLLCDMKIGKMYGSEFVLTDTVNYLKANKEIDDAIKNKHYKKSGNMRVKDETKPIATEKTITADEIDF